MVEKQKETVLTLLKSNEANKHYSNGCWFLYKDFLDPTDDFTDFSCENLEGKQEYLTLIENLLSADETAQIFVEVYGFEKNNNDEFIYADTLIIFSKLSLLEIKQTFNESKNIVPSDIGELTDFLHQNFVMDENGDLISVANLFNSSHFAYYCWWD